MRGPLCLALARIFALPQDLRWIRDGNPTPQALAMVLVLQSAALQGLDPDDYDGSLWHERRVRRTRSVSSSSISRTLPACTCKARRRAACSRARAATSAMDASAVPARLPVLILYSTAVVRADGTVHFFF